MSTLDGYERQAQLLRALSHPVRLRILDILACCHEACVCHLGAILNRPQPYVSQQLATLREAGLVSDRRERTLMYYHLADERITAWLDQYKGLLREEEELAFPPVPEGALPNCPCPHCQE